MSGEAFETVLDADVRTAPDRRGMQVTRSGALPRWVDGHRDGWVNVRMYAEPVIRVAAFAVADQPMDGLSGDLPEKRAFAAGLLQAVADLVRDLALDNSDNSQLTEEKWQARVDAIRGLLDGAAYPPEGMSTRSGAVLVLDPEKG